MKCCSAGFQHSHSRVEKKGNPKGVEEIHIHYENKFTKATDILYILTKF